MTERQGGEVVVIALFGLVVVLLPVGAAMFVAKALNNWLEAHQ